MKYKATAKSSGGLETVSWILKARSPKEGLALAREGAAHILGDRREQLHLESVPGNTSSMIRWIGIFAVVLAAVIPPALSSYLTARATINQEVMQRRQEALFDALRVVNYVYANSDFSGFPAPAGPRWDMMMARDAMNKMLVYCERPETTVKVWERSIGVHPFGTPATTYSAAGIDDFRKAVARELHRRTPSLDSAMSWMYSLPGTVEESIMRSTSNVPSSR